MTIVSKVESGILHHSLMEIVIQIEIHCDSQKDRYNALKRKSTEPIYPSQECKPAQRDSINLNWKRDRCGEECKVNPHNINRVDWYKVWALPITKNILDECLKKTDAIRNIKSTTNKH